MAASTTATSKSAVIRQAVDAFREAGAQVTEDMHPYYKEMIAIRTALNAAEGRATVRRLADKWGTRTLAGANNFIPSGMATEDMTEMLEKQDQYRSAMLSWFQKYDVIVCPNAVSPATVLSDVGPANLYYNSIYNIAGWPAGVVRGGREDMVMATAGFIEGKLGGYRRPPI